MRFVVKTQSTECWQGARATRSRRGTYCEEESNTGTGTGTRPLSLSNFFLTWLKNMKVPQSVYFLVCISSFVM